MKTALVIAAHPDDEVLGCGGTAARLIRQGWEVHALIVAEGATSRAQQRDTEANQDELAALHCAAHRAAAIIGYTSLQLGDLPDNRMDCVDLLDVVKRIENAIATLRPVRVYTHHGGDVNIDHQVLHRAVVTACRPLPGALVREIFFFETPSSTEWSVGVANAFLPNCFSDIEDTLEIKLAALQAYASEMRAFPHPRSIEAVTLLARWRGACSGFNSAEAFSIGRILLP